MHATIIQMKEQVKEIIVSIAVEILRCIIGKLNRRIQTKLQPEKGCFYKQIDRCNKTLKSQLSASFCFIHPWILKKLQPFSFGTFFRGHPVYRTI